MSYCYHDGHEVRHPSGNYCGQHGAALFDRCPRCGTRWDGGLAGYSGARQAFDFCTGCAHPAPWVSRKKRIDWVKARLHEEGLDPALALELRETLDELRQRSKDDTRALAAWRQLKATAPRLWTTARPVIESLVSEGLKKYLFDE